VSSALIILLRSELARRFRRISRFGAVSLEGATRGGSRKVGQRRVIRRPCWRLRHCGRAQLSRARRGDRLAHIIDSLKEDRVVFVTVVAVMCHLLAGTSECREEVVTDSNMTVGLTVMGCMVGAQASLAKWKSEHPIYRREEYRIERYKCVPGQYKPLARAWFANSWQARSAIPLSWARRLAILGCGPFWFAD
jgi:hypothetical protein